LEELFEDQGLVELDGPALADAELGQEPEDVLLEAELVLAALAEQAANKLLNNELRIALLLNRLDIVIQDLAEALEGHRIVRVGQVVAVLYQVLADLLFGLLVALGHVFKDFVAEFVDLLDLLYLALAVGERHAELVTAAEMEEHLADELEHAELDEDALALGVGVVSDQLDRGVLAVVDEPDQHLEGDRDLVQQAVLHLHADELVVGPVQQLAELVDQLLGTEHKQHHPLDLLLDLVYPEPMFPDIRVHLQGVPLRGPALSARTILLDRVDWSPLALALSVLLVEPFQFGFALADV
jgi:hypothetical protein